MAPFTLIALASTWNATRGTGGGEGGGDGDGGVGGANGGDGGEGGFEHELKQLCVTLVVIAAPA